MNNCPVCENMLKPVRLACDKCGITMEGNFRMTRLARLTRNEQKLAEAFILSGGNLKDLSSQLDVSYPTLRKKIDDLMAALSDLQKQDESEISKILDAVEAKEIEAEEGIRLIKEMGNEI